MTDAVVLGATGFVGSHVGAALRAAGLHVTPAGRDAARDLAGLLGDLRPRLVVNAAGAAWDAGFEHMYDANYLLVTRLLRALAPLPRPPLLLHVGTAAEYGPGSDGTALAETDPAHPGGHYGRTKLLGCRAVLAAARSGRPAGVLRVFSVIGPRAPRASLPGRVAAELADARREGRTAVLRLAPLVDRRDFVDVRDVAAAVVAAAAGPAVPLINIGRGVAVPVRRVVDRLISVSGVPARVAERAGDGPHAPPVVQRADIRTAREVLGWAPVRELDDSVRGLWETARAPTTVPSGVT